MPAFSHSLAIVTFITFILCTLSIYTKAQNQITKEIYLKKNQDTESKVHLGQSIKQAVSVLGKPDKAEQYYYEADEKMGKLYHYGKSHVFFMDAKLDGFTIADSSLVVGLDYGLEVRAGDSLKADKFKNYKVSYRQGTSFNIFAVSFIELHVRLSDDSIFLLFDENDKLNGIAYYSPI